MIARARAGFQTTMPQIHRCGNFADVWPLVAAVQAPILAYDGSIHARPFNLTEFR